MRGVSAAPRTMESGRTGTAGAGSQRGGTSEFSSIQRGAQTLGADQRGGARNLPARAPNGWGTGTGSGPGSGPRAREGGESSSGDGWARGR